MGELALRSRARALRGAATDVARWAFWVRLRDALDPADPASIRAFYPLWRAQHRAARGQRALMRDEYRRCFGDGYSRSGLERVVADAYRVAFRVHFEELLLGKLTPETWPHYLRFEGRANLDAALSRGKGAIILFPHAGNFMMMIASVSLAGYPYTQYAARGMAPADVAEAHPDVFGHNRWREQARETREANEDRLPARFISLDTPVRHLYRCLERNEVVGLAFDGRIGNRFTAVDYLGRKALVNPGAYRMAMATGASIVPTLCHTPADGPDVCTFGAPIAPDGRRVEELIAAYVHGAVEPFIRAHPEEYGIWLAHCRERAGVDDHPFFLDYAPDDRWRRHAPELP